MTSQLIKKRRWQLLQLESAIACNLKCVMCPWPEYAKRAKNHGIMQPEIWDAIRPHLSQVRSVDFTGGGEPLLQPRLVEWIREANAAGCETGILTNGLMLNEKRARQILDTGINWICISMDGATRELYEQIRIGSNFDRVSKNVANLVQIRNGKIPKLMINFVLMTINFHQIEEIIHLAARLGVDQVNFKQCEVIRGDRGKGYGLFAPRETKEVRKLKKTLRKGRRLAKKMGIHTTAFSFTPEEQPVCDQDPRDSLFIRYDGVVAPCINLALGGPTTFLDQEVVLPSVHYGCLPEDDLLELWETETCRFYRHRFQNRVKIHDGRIVESFIGGSTSNRLNALKDARESLPAAPKGCDVCHYLYDI